MFFLKENEQSKEISSGVFHGILYALLFLIASWFLGSVIDGVTGWGMDDCDKSAWHRCGADVITDERTGLQYLKTQYAITPRLGSDGKQLHE